MGCNPSSAGTQAIGGSNEETKGTGNMNSKGDIWDSNYGDPSDGFYTGMNMGEDDLSYSLELHFSCKSLPNLDVMSKTDPLCVIYERDPRTLQWIKRGRTEMVKDSLNPQFIKSVVIRYRFEEKQSLMVEVYDIDNEESIRDLKKQELVGRAEMFVHSIMRNGGKPLTQPLTHPSRSKNGEISIWGEQVDPSLASQLVLMGICGKVSRGQYFYKVYRAKSEDSLEMIPIYRSEVRKGSSLTWNNARILSSVLCRNDSGRNIMIEILEWVSNGNHRSLHKETICLLTISSQPVTFVFPKGEITLLPYRIQKEYSFMEYLHGGLEISLIIAVDFTASNGSPQSPTSLHYYDLNQNQYLQAMHAVGSVLEPYDFDGHIPLLGFGATHNNQISHCYSITPGEGAQGMAGIFEYYKNYLPSVKLGGPTYFMEILRYAKGKAQEMVSSNPNAYLVFMILTDGLYVDEQESIDQIVHASKLPLSIIIVGVGNENFALLERLDADEEPLRASGGQYMARDIVQFVPFNKYKGQPQMLASETLAEVPRQVVVYFNKVGHNPQHS